MNQHIGQSFDGFLEDENLFNHIVAAVFKREFAAEIQSYIQTSEANKNHFIKKLQISSKELSRLLDPECLDISLEILFRAANIIGKHIEIQLSNKPSSVEEDNIEINS